MSLFAQEGGVTKTTPSFYAFMCHRAGMMMYKPQGPWQGLWSFQD